MAVYKVPQDVEAEDKLLGPLTFKQFIFLMIAVGSAVFAWLLFRVNPYLVVLPLPLILVFGGLAVFRREDQPVERYLLSFFNYTLRPRIRLWNTEGYYDHLVITAPKRLAPAPLKQNLREVHGQLEKLAQLVDTRGWASKRPELQLPGNSMFESDDDRLFMPEQTAAEPAEIHERDDMMGETNPEVIELEQRLQEAAERQRTAVLERVRTQAVAPPPTATPAPVDKSGVAGAVPPPEPAITAPPPLPDYAKMALAGDNELSVSQIAAEAKRRSDELQAGQEIGLREVA